MKNLRVTKTITTEWGINIMGNCIDFDNECLFILTDKFEIIRFDISCNSQTIVPVKLDYQLLSANQIEAELKDDDIILFDYNVEMSSVIVALRRGCILRIAVTSHSPPSETLFQHSREISSVKQSPDQDLIVVADVDGEIISLNPHGSLLERSNAITNKESKHKPVGVGWGSKETQFFGLDGRPSKEKQLKEQVILSEDELAKIAKIESSESFIVFQQRQAKQTVIDWRGDGQYLATLTYIADSDKHYLQVWNRNLELQYISEQLVTIERGVMSWVPDGKYVCCAQRRDKRVNDIAMFEKNGMVHQRLTLPLILADAFVKDIRWSADSQILAIIAYKFDVTDDQVDYTPILMLYTMQNFHYYLKYSVQLRKNCNHSLVWDPNNQSRFHTISSDGEHSEFDCKFVVDFSNDLSTVAIIDANNVLITPMQVCNIPPPMSAIKLEISSLIYKIVVNPHDASNYFIFTMDHHLIRISPNAPDNAYDELVINFHLKNHTANGLFERLKNYHVIKITDISRCQNLTFINESSLVVSLMSQERWAIVLMSFDQLKGKIFCHYLLWVPSTVFVTGICPSLVKNTETIWVTLSDRTTMECGLDGTPIQEIVDPNTNLPTCPRSSYCFVGMQYIISPRSKARTLISLAEDLNLRVDSSIIAANSCLSFQVTDNYITYTTTDNTLSFILKSRLMDHKDSENPSYESWCQPIEALGSLIVASEEDAKVVLQMPRGNLEILHPRILVFSTLTKLLDEQAYIQAVNLARRHRLNMNFLIDYLMRLYPDSKELTRFASDIAQNDPALLNLLITELENSDTIIGRYAGIMTHLPDRRVDFKQKFQALDKVNHVCSLVELPEDVKYLQPRILCLLKSTPRKVGQALQIIKQLDKDIQSNALKFMLYYLDIDQLFIEALCTYDTDITLMVASASNKDPKEYLVLLDSFNKIENKNLRCHKIDVHVKRYEEAFSNLFNYYSDCSTLNSETVRVELIDLVVSKRIFKAAIAILDEHKNQSSLKETIWAKYAAYLLEKRRHIEAGVAYSKAMILSSKEEHFLGSLKCFMMADDWEKSAALVARSCVPDHMKETSLRKISKQLIASGRCSDALIVLQSQKPSDLTIEDISEFISRGSWYLAELFAGDAGSLEKISVSVSDAASVQLTAWTTEFSTAKDHFERLKELLVTYHTRKFVDYEPSKLMSDTVSTVDGSDLQSSVGSLEGADRQKSPRSGASSIKTAKTNKSIAAKKKKRINLKRDTRYEDMAIVLQLKSFITKQRSNHDEALRISAALFQYCSLELARQETTHIYQVLTDSFVFSGEILELLWPSSPQNEQRYSLYRRFNSVLTCANDSLENVDLEVMMRPELPKDLIRFEL